MRTRRIGLLVGALVTATACLVAGPTRVAEAANLSFTVAGSPVTAGVGIDAPGVEYQPCNDQVGPGGTFTKAIPSSGATVRVELYPGGCAHLYDGWGNVGGIHFDLPPSGGNYPGGTVRLPVAPNDGFKIQGNILSSTPVGDGRVKVDTFQVADFQQASVAYGAFASTSSRGTRWSGGVGWGGQYLFFVEDTATGTKIQALHQLSPGTIPTIDLDAVCFGFDPCLYMSGGPPNAAGDFHPLEPTRVLDTRVGLGISSAVESGDGRNGDPNPFVRLYSALNHELQVTGRYGVPATGVSAVLLNVTATDAAAPSWLSVVPKPARVGDVYNDQGSFGAFPNTSNLNFEPGVATPNLVLARVGAGGKIRLANFTGPTHVIADIAGYVGTGGAHTDGAGFEGIVPDRLVDTRQGLGGARFQAGESRSIQVAGVKNVPRNASSVVVNITTVGASSSGYATAYPDGTSVPNASNVNFQPRSVRANTAVVKVGANGAIRVRAAESDVDIIVDVLGSFGPYGGRVTSITPERFVDSRSGIGTHAAPMGQNETRTFQIAGRGGVPADATAVIANLTAVAPTSVGYFTAWPAGNPQPTSSNLNFLWGQTVPNLVMLKLGGNGAVSVFNEAGSTQVLLDVMGYVR
jgi:hypothetical protein